jgi:signal transduction histidine kinase
MRRRITALSGTLFIFSFVITSFLIAAFILYIKYLPTPQLSLPGYLANLNESFVISSLEEGSGMIPIRTINGFIAKDQIENMYFSAMLEDLPYLLLVILFIFLSGAVILSKILQRQQEKQALLLARQLSRIDENNGIVPGHPAIAKAYSDIKERLAANVQDFVRLSSFVTHEQKNMLSLLRAKLQLSCNDDLLRDVDKVVDSLNDILTLSASVNDSDPEIIDVALVCADVCDEYKKIYPDIFFDFDDSANYLIAARELWINRAVSNLVNNAIKYGKGRIEVSVSNQKGSVIISVSDEGSGLDDKELEKLFDYRYRVGQLKKDGYGIGLSLVKHVCDLCGGLCRAENGKTKGMVFYMVFPEALTID